MNMYNSTISGILPFLDTHKVIVDTCSLMHSHADAVFSCLIPELERRGKRLTAPMDVVEEIVFNKRTGRSAECRSNATAAREIVEQLIAKGCLAIDPSHSDKSFADLSIGVILQTERVSRPLLLITQDKALAQKAMLHNIDMSVRGHKIEVMKIECPGRIVHWNTNALLSDIQGYAQAARTYNTPHNIYTPMPYTPVPRAGYRQPSYTPAPCTDYRQPSYTPVPRADYKQTPYTSAPRSEYRAQSSRYTPVAPKVPKRAPKANNSETCIDCGAPFTVTVKEAQALMQKGYYFPKRCKACREARRTQKAAAGFHKFF